MSLRNVQSIWSVKSLIRLAAVVGSAATFAPGAAQAGELFNNWNYAIDSFQDGTEYSTIGDDSAFEFYGLAYREYEDKVVFAVNSNLAPDGYASGGAMGGAIGYGDLFINFGGGTLAEAEGTGDLYAVDFTNNDTNRGTGEGLYSNVSSKSLTRRNQGYSSIQQHTNTVNNYLGGEASFGDRDADTTYFQSNRAARTHIKRGTYASAITQMGSGDFDSDLDFGNFGAVGQYTFGFSVDKSALQVGNFVAHLFAECGNDGVVIDGELIGDVSAQAVPESSPLAAVAAIGLFGGAALLRKRKQQLEAQLAEAA